MNKSFDVFLSHNSKDKPAVRELAEALRARGLQVWLDEWELVPGQPWQEALEEVIETTRSSAVLVGKDGLGPWQDAEMRGCLSEFVDRKLPVIPVLLPGAPEVPRLPFFLKRFTWVDLRGGLNEEGIDRLQWGITGSRPDRSKLSSIPPAAPEVAVAAAEAQPAPAEVRPVPPEVEAPAAVAKERPGQRARVLWGVPAWIYLSTLLGITVFLSYHYFPKLDIDRPVQDEAIVQPAADNPETDTPGNGPKSRNAAPKPVPAATQTKSVMTGLETCVPGKEREENGIVFARICPGTFTMGSAENDPQAYDSEKPAHQVTLSEFWIGKTEITNEQYRRLRPDHPGEPRLPAVLVSWNDAQAACERFGGRLPSEAEWEYAARAGSHPSSLGDDEKMLGNYAWYDKNAGNKPHPVATRKPNAWGLYDMYGNVWEWVADWYGPYEKGQQTDPTGPQTGDDRSFRGGSFVNSPDFMFVRFMGGPEYRAGGIGFRCARAARRQP